MNVRLGLVKNWFVHSWGSWLLLIAFSGMTKALSAARTQPSVAIIGGGIAGLSCAQHLSSHLDVTVFDTGRLRPGGRCSSRQPGDLPKEKGAAYKYLDKCAVDHVAQIVPMPDEGDGDMQDFGQQLLIWEKQGTVKQFPADSLFNIVKPRRSQRQDPSGFQLRPFGTDKAVFHGTEGNAAIPLAMAKGDFDLVQDVWVSPNNGVRYQANTKKWKVQASGKVLGYFDKLVIAHNGKCADRLMSKSPAKWVHSMLRVNFSSSAPKDGGKRMTLNSIYSLTIAVATTNTLRGLPATFQAGYVQNEPSLRFLCCQSRKYPSTPLTSEDGIEIWTVLSSAAFAKKHKAPQEFIPEEKATEVMSLLLQGLERSLGMDHESIKPLESRLQLWGAGVPLNTWQSDECAGFLYDSEYSVGVCGDWLVQSSIAGAWTSGRRLANHLLGAPNAETVGRNGRFVRSEQAHQGGIASFGERAREPAASHNES